MQSTCLLCRFSQLDLMLDYSINLLVIFPPGYLEIFSGSISLTYIPNCTSFFLKKTELVYFEYVFLSNKQLQLHAK